ncbi:MAG: signal peptidase II [Clostridia bacterium]
MIEIIIVIAVLVMDQVSKVICAGWLTQLPGNSYPLIEGVFHLTYVENRGAAFGMLQNARWFFLAITLCVCAYIVFLLIKDNKKMHKLMRVCLALILGGALGNFIDRAVLGYVRDMLHFALIDFAVFNVADSALTVGTILFVCDLLFGKARIYVGAANKTAKTTDSAAQDDSIQKTEDKD